MNFTQKSLRIGTITQGLAIIANFLPPVFLAVYYDVLPNTTDLLALWGILFATYFFNWWVQPLAYFPRLGIAGTYIAHLAGSVADIRLPAIAMAHKSSGVEPSTPEGDAIAAMGVSATVLVSFTTVTLFTFIGVLVIPYFPKFIIDSFTYILPALFGAVYTDMTIKNKPVGFGTIVLLIAIYVLWSFTSLNSGLKPLVCVAVGALVARFFFVRQQQKTGKEASN